ncbi:MAG: YgfZ/GcvT domain-containing protein [Kiloniellales bacterium]
MSESARALLLEGRGVLSVAGPDREPFLQGLVSNDVTKADRSHAIWSAFLTPQGKFLHEFFLLAETGRYLLDCEAARLDDLKTRLSRFRLRSKVELTNASDAFAVGAAFGERALAALGLPEQRGAAKSLGGGCVFVDPRLTQLGARLLLPAATAQKILAELGLKAATTEDYDSLRLSLGVPDGSRDLEVEKATLMESGFDELNGISWDKGCYMGQELTARMRYRGLAKKRLLPVEIEGETPPPGAAILRDGQEVGTLRSAAGGKGLALLRLEAVAGPEARPLTAQSARLRVRRPAWLRLPEPAARPS